MKPNYLSFGSSSKHLLAVTKAKAKMVELSITEQHLETKIAPQKLLTLTIGILGELSSLISRGIEDRERINHLKNELKKTAQYFDSLNQTELEPELRDYLNLLGASAYYLLDMPGSASVLIKRIHSNYNSYEQQFTCNLKLTLHPSLEIGLVWFLKHNHLNDGRLFPRDLNALNSAIINIFEKFYSCEYFHIEQTDVNLFLEKIYELGNDRELLFSHILIAILKAKLQKLSTNNLPKYTGLPLNSWMPVLQKKSFIKEFWPAQEILGESEVFRGRSAVIQLPTGAGKTKSTEIIIRSAFLSGRTNVAVIIAPFRALVNEISADFRQAFSGEENMKINQLSDIPHISSEENRILIELLQGYLDSRAPINTVVITTPEKLLYLLRQKPELKEIIGLVILDEGHQFDSGSRGITYELLLTELKMSLNATTQFVLISAVISNAEQIGRWLYGEKGIAIHSLENLSTSKTVAYTNWQTELGQLHYIDPDMDNRSYFVPRLIKRLPLDLRGKESKERFFPEKTPNDIASYLGIILCQQHTTAIFCGQARTVRSICEIIVDAYSRGYTYRSSPANISNQEELVKIYNLSALHLGQDHVFSQAINFGILPHGASVPNGIRVASEWAIANHKANLIVCTSTLAQGVNLPLKYLVVSNIYQGKEQISTRDFQNLAGRVGRSGYFTEGDIIFADNQVFEERSNSREKWRWERVNNLLVENNSEACISNLIKIIKPIPIIQHKLPSDWVLRLSENLEYFELQVHELIEELREYPENFNVEENDVTEAQKEIEYDWVLKKKIIQSIENFMIAYLKDNKDVQLLDLMALAQNTLAYFLMEDQSEKELFIQVFSILANKVNKLEDSKKIYFGKTLLGINDLKKIENYLLNEVDLSRVSNEVALLKEIWSFIVSLIQGEFIHKMALEATKNIAILWIQGKSLFEIDKFIQSNNYKYKRGKQQGTIYIEQLMQLTSNNFGHDLSMIIGAMADICDGIDNLKNHSEMFRNLQSRMRVGLPDKLSLFLYEKGYVDREICKLIANRLEKNGIHRENFYTRDIEANRYIILDVLKDYPSYFSEKSLK